MDEVRQSPIKKIKLVVTIVDRGLGDEVVELLKESGVTYTLISPAYCGSGSAIMDYHGLSSQERDLIFSVVTEDKVKDVLNKVLYKFDLDEPGNGMAFAIPISGVSGPLALRYISGIFDC